MRKSTLAFIGLILFTDAYAQKTEFKASLNSGLFSFTGKSAESSTFINYAPVLSNPYTNNPYGSRNGFCYGLAGDVQRVARKNFIAGLGLGYEVLRSKILIDGASGYPVGMTIYGRTFLEYHFINLHPFVGYRFTIKKLYLDITGGVDIAWCLQAWEKISASWSDGTKVNTSRDRQTIKSDARPRIQLSMGYKKIGMYAGYSYGIANYMTGYVGGVNECYARLVRFGLTYQIK